MTRRYLVVLDFPTGIAQLANVLIVKAESPQQARELACRQMNLVEDATRNFVAHALDDLNDGWAYFR
jgi:hypothetical protein